MNVLTVSGSPHIHGKDTTKKIMYSVIIALVPAILCSIYFYGIDAVRILLISVTACLFFEWAIQKYLIKGALTINDGSALVTAILYALILPSNLPSWIVVIGALIAIGMGKMSFGGLGKNIFNPALVARVFLLISFPVNMTSWPRTTPILNGLFVDITTGATSLGIFKEAIRAGKTVIEISPELPSLSQSMIFSTSGSMGEISAIAIIIGGIFLIWKKTISWHIPVSMILTVAIFSGILWSVDPEHYANPLFHLFSGGLLLGAFFMATDMVSSPMTKGGKLIFGFGIGLLTILIRLWGAYPEGVAFAILLMNAVVPLINRGFKPKRFGANTGVKLNN